MSIMIEAKPLSAENATWLLRVIERASIPAVDAGICLAAVQSLQRIADGKDAATEVQADADA